MINRIRIISIILLKIFKSKIKIKTSLPKNIQIIYFENYTKQKLKHIINKNVKTFCLAGRFYETNTIYINFKIFLNYIKNLKYGISISYYISLIESLNPKLVMTIIDNSISFNILTKTLYKKIPFVSIQQSNRPEIYGNDYKFKNGYDTYNKNKSKFIDKFYTIADCDLFNHKKKKIIINYGKSIGSLPLAIALNIIKKEKIKINKDKYDVCLISDGFTLRLDNYYKVPGWEKNSALFLKSMINIIKKNKLKFIFCTKRIISINKDEETFYKKYLTKDEMNFLYSNSTIRNIREVVSPSYVKIQESKLSIGIWSTLLRENLQLGGKSLIVSTDPLKIYKYPINSNICNIHFSSQNKLEKKILKLIKMSKKKYFSLFGKKKNFYIYPDYKNTIIELKKEISQYIY